MTPPAGTAPVSTTRDLPSDAATEALGAAIAPLLRAGDVVALYGELGAGKTTLARSLITQRGYKGDVPSPTFTLVQIYDLTPVAVWHFDLYRIDDSAEVIELGVEEAFADAISLIEWPERMEALLPPDRLDVVLTYLGEDEGRRVVLVGHGDWRDRLVEVSDDL